MYQPPSMSGSHFRDQQHLNGSSWWILVDIIGCIVYSWLEIPTCLFHFKSLPHFGFNLTQHPPSSRTSLSVLVCDGPSSSLGCPKLDRHSLLQNDLPCNALRERISMQTILQTNPEASGKADESGSLVISSLS
jgi:hypothetical protein